MKTKAVNVVLLLFLVSTLHAQNPMSQTNNLALDKSNISLNRYISNDVVDSEIRLVPNPFKLDIRVIYSNDDLTPTPNVTLNPIIDHPLFKQFHGDKFCISVEAPNGALRIISPSTSESVIQHLIVVNPFPDRKKD